MTIAVLVRIPDRLPPGIITQTQLYLNCSASNGSNGSNGSNESTSDEGDASDNENSKSLTTSNALSSEDEYEIIDN
jgi:hypothetical protein